MARPKNPSRRTGTGPKRPAASAAPDERRSPKAVFLEVAGWFRPAALAEMHAALLRGELDASADDAPARPPAASAEPPFDFRPVWVLVAAAILLTAMEYNPGKRYVDFNPSRDRVAELGLKALIHSLAAEDLGLVALLKAIMIKFWKVLAVAAVAVVAGVAKVLFDRSRSVG